MAIRLFGRTGWFGCVSAIAGAACFQAAAFGQTYHVAPTTIDVGPWTFNAVIQDAPAPAAGEPQGPPRVIGFLALAAAGGAVGNNIVSVWYQSNPATGAWTAKAWTSTDPWVAVKSIRDTYSISGEEDDLWKIHGESANIPPSGETPQDYENGLLRGDPLFALVNAAPNRDQIVEALVMVGYTAADLPIEKGDMCAKDDRLTVFAAATVESITGEEATRSNRATAAIETGMVSCCIAGGSIVLELLGPELSAPPVDTYSIFTRDVFIGGGQVTTEKCQLWIRTFALTQSRIRVKICMCDMQIGQLPLPCGFCYQTRTGTRHWRWLCCEYCILADCSLPADPPPPPTPAPPPLPPWVVTLRCGSPVFSGYKTWNGWNPACGF